MELGKQGNPDPDRQRQYVLTHKWVLDIKQRKTSLESMIPEKTGNKENPKRDIHKSLWEGKTDKAS